MADKMRALILTEFGGPDVLRVKETEKPVPAPDEVLIRVKAAGVGYGDLILRNLKNLPSERFYMPGIFRPLTRLMVGFSKPKKKILGSQFSGVVEGSGERVSKFNIGDEVFGYTEIEGGSYAEYICRKEGSLIALKPANLSHEEASALPYGALTAWKALQKIDIESPDTSGKNILVNGASGSIGSYCVQLLKLYGARVTGVAGPSGQEYMKALGADRTLDYTREDFTKSEETYDVIVDVLGKLKFAAAKKNLSPGGMHLYLSYKTPRLFSVLGSALFGSKKAKIGMASYKPEDLTRLREFAESGKIQSVLDKTFPLEKGAAAHAYMESRGGGKGAVVLMM